jgi:hypothetical protein
MTLNVNCLCRQPTLFAALTIRRQKNWDDKEKCFKKRHFIGFLMVNGWFWYSQICIFEGMLPLRITKGNLYFQCDFDVDKGKKFLQVVYNL